MDDRDEAGDPKFYFMEMNTRLQVEHPVTEAITGQDLVEWQLRVARGEMLPLMQDALECHGHAVEARLYAENPDKGFLPSTGTLSQLSFGPGARIDTGVEQGGEVTVHYDPMIAKIITHAPTREEALAKLVAALDRTLVEGVTTNRGFLARLASHHAFVGGEVDTGFIARHEAALFEVAPPPPAVVATAAANWSTDAGDSAANGPFARRFRLNLPPVSSSAFWQEDGTEHRFISSPDGIRLSGELQPPARDIAIIPIDGGVEARRRGQSWRFLGENPVWSGASASGPSDGQIVSPMPGKLIGLFVKPGDTVQAGDRLAVLEAMKMEHRLTAPFDATVVAVSAEAGAQLTEGTLLITLARPDQDSSK